ncbi:MAG: DUF3054 domain-containing protein [Anaerolineales bacterium]|nr:DUF3054 domain-containing protein [Anaerolineales bacterium]
MSKRILFLCDVLAIAVVTYLGFVFHGEPGLDILPRFLVSAVPLTITWFLLAPWFGLFQTEIISNPKHLWRPAFVMLFAAPLAALMRAVILNSIVVPIFATVLMGTSALGMVLWRGIYYWLQSRK